MDREFDVLGQYRAITSKLKRRFLKKPNVSEASDQFGSLAKELKRQDCPQYAGFCSLAKARCENTLSNATGEVEALTEAARLFLEAEKNCVELRCPAFEEHLTEAIHLFNQAIKTHCAQGNSALGACLCLEIGDALRHMNRPHEAMVHYQHAAELQHQNPIDALQSMTLVASCKIETGKLLQTNFYITKCGFQLLVLALVRGFFSWFSDIPPSKTTHMRTRRKAEVASSLYIVRIPRVVFKCPDFNCKLRYSCKDTFLLLSFGCSFYVIDFPYLSSGTFITYTV